MRSQWALGSITKSKTNGGESHNYVKGNQAQKSTRVIRKKIGYLVKFEFQINNEFFIPHGPKEFLTLKQSSPSRQKKKKLLNASTRHHLITPTQQKQKRVRRGGKNPQKNCTRKVFMTQITTMVWSLT